MGCDRWSYWVCRWTSARLLPRADLDLAADAVGEGLDGLRVFVEREPAGDEEVGVQHTVGEQVGGSFEAVQDGHGAGDGDFLVVDAVGLDGGSGGVFGHPELQEGAALADLFEAVLDGFLVAGGVDDHVPAA